MVKATASRALTARPSVSGRWRGRRRAHQKWRKDYNDGGCNRGDNWRQGINYHCMGGTNNAINGHKAAVARLVKEGYLDGSDSGQFKHRDVVEKPSRNILVHVESTDTL
ncbi:MAG: hypothetical protein H7099_16625 [Gemmatimonadaceae bacterium]|nr:hypothetical protein [Gemmatimonadaceae bacterium]